jgi:hypothetical protein
MPMETETWLKLPESASGRSATLAAELEERVQQRLRTDEFKADEIKYVGKLDMRPVKGDLNISESELEKLRRLCQVWDIELRTENITSHRKVIGPLIVWTKKLILPVLKALFRNMIEQQKEFNAAAISLLAEIGNRKKE